MSQDLASRLLAGDRRALARSLTVVENGGAEGADLLKTVFSSTGKAHMIGITGAAGSGKSTVTNALTSHYRAESKTVGIIAVDPSSPFTHGAVLGDRIRMLDHWSDQGVFIRSMATRGALGGLAATSFEAALILDAAGMDIVIVETVGAGQDEVEIAGLADSTVVINTPSTGDDIQAMKAGILEVADVLVVNKADLPGADTLVAQLTALLEMGAERPWKVPIVKVVARDGTGIPELADSLARHRSFLLESGEIQKLRKRQARSQIESILKVELLREAVRQSGGEASLESAADRVATRQTDPRTAARQLSQPQVTAK
ncbi:MAG TPA: methylmalonyl Co-A mutase-associated GTPase MeaB [Dehalococcoidia bacterium]|nr:methylmalonyl Co-A mutase-associated GTPase MeaB [Dehalococcoidia bacterium]